MTMGGMGGGRGGFRGVDEAAQRKANAQAPEIPNLGRRVTGLFTPYRWRIAGETQESLSELTSITQETLSVSGVLLSKAFNRQGAEAQRYRDENANQIRLQVRRAMSGQGFFAVVQVLMSSVPAVIYLVSGYLITGGSADITAGTVVAFTTVQARLLQPLLGLMRVALDLQTSKALFARIFEYLDMIPAIQDAPDAIRADGAPGPRGQIEFRDVVFRYPDSPADARAAPCCRSRTGCPP